MPQEEIETLADQQKLAQGKRVVRLKGGDPFVFGRGAEEAQALRAAGIPFEVVPGITSAIAAPAYAGIPVTHRSHNPAFTVATGHEDPTKPASTIDWARLADPHRTLVLLMAIGNLRDDRRAADRARARRRDARRGRPRRNAADAAHGHRHARDDRRRRRRRRNRRARNRDRR